MLTEIIVPDTAGLSDLRRLLSQAENNITRLTPMVAQYRIDRANARNAYDEALNDAKVAAMAEHGLKPNHQTMINAIANSDNEVKRLKQAWLNAKAIEIKAEERLKQSQGQRDTLKAMVKSEQASF